VRGTATTSEPAERGIIVEHPPAKRRLWRRRSNRRITVSGPSVLAWLADALRTIAGKLALVGKALVVVAFVAGAVWAGRRVVRHVIASPRFAVHDVAVGPSTRVSADEIRALAGVQIGDHLLAVDPDAVAARLATHPWILAARVRRELPSTLAIEVTERRAVASALLGALYLLDADGRPFKRATFAEADGLPVVTGVTRDQYAAVRSTSEAVFRQALELFATYGDGHPERPKLSEVHVDTRAGFSLVLFDGSGEIRLGRGDFEAKLARLDRIFGALGDRGPAALATVYLDGPLSDRVTVRMAGSPKDDDPAPPRPTVASEKSRPTARHPAPSPEPAPPARDGDQTED
jgi:cell division septal protein FtsQ